MGAHVSTNEDYCCLAWDATYRDLGTRLVAYANPYTKNPMDLTDEELQWTNQLTGFEYPNRLTKPTKSTT